MGFFIAVKIALWKCILGMAWPVQVVSPRIVSVSIRTSGSNVKWFKFWIGKYMSWPVGERATLDLSQQSWGKFIPALA